MLKKIFSVYDSKSKSFSNPVYLSSTAVAVRVFGDSVNDSDSASPLNKHPADYTLFELGTFDDSTSSFVLYDSPLSLHVAIELLDS